MSFNDAEIYRRLNNGDVEVIAVFKKNANTGEYSFVKVLE